MNICEVCGQPAQDIVYLNELNMIICGRCNAHRYKCLTCESARLCDFETNPIPIPKMVQRKISRGNLTSIVTIKNPARIEKTCAANCPCFNKKEGICNKEQGYCYDGYHLVNSPKNTLLP